MPPRNQFVESYEQKSLKKIISQLIKFRIWHSSLTSSNWLNGIKEERSVKQDWKRKREKIRSIHFLQFYAQKPNWANFGENLSLQENRSENDIASERWGASVVVDCFHQSERNVEIHADWWNGATFHPCLLVDFFFLPGNVPNIKFNFPRFRNHQSRFSCFFAVSSCWWVCKIRVMLALQFPTELQLSEWIGLFWLWHNWNLLQIL